MSNEIPAVVGSNLDFTGYAQSRDLRTTTLAEHVERFTKLASDAGFSVRHVQSNFEGDLIEAVHGARESAVAIVINAGALTHSSWALADAPRHLQRNKGGGPPLESRGARALSSPQHARRFGQWFHCRIRATSYELALDAVRRLTSRRRKSGTEARCLD